MPLTRHKCDDKLHQLVHFTINTRALDNIVQHFVSIILFGTNVKQSIFDKILRVAHEIDDIRVLSES